MEEKQRRNYPDGDFNQHIYKGKLQEAFAVEDIGLEEKFRKLYDDDALFSHITGSIPICCVCAISGIDCEAALISSHKAGVGDHRLHVFDFSAESILGLEIPAVCKPGGRNLRCNIEQTRVNYCRVLMQLSNNRRML